MTYPFLNLPDKIFIKHILRNRSIDLVLRHGFLCESNDKKKKTKRNNVVYCKTILICLATLDM